MDIFKTLDLNKLWQFSPSNVWYQSCKPQCDHASMPYFPLKEVDGSGSWGSIFMKQVECNHFSGIETSVYFVVLFASPHCKQTVKAWQWIHKGKHESWVVKQSDSQPKDSGFEHQCPSSTSRHPLSKLPYMLTCYWNAMQVALGNSVFSMTK